MPIDYSYMATSADLFRQLADDKEAEKLLDHAGELLSDTLSAGGKIFLAGNGGSAAISQHLVGDLIVRFRMERAGLAAIALSVDTTILTAAFDYDPEAIYSRQIEALARPGDVFWAFSTSGTSKNIIHACQTARKLGMRVLGFTGQTGGEMSNICDLCFQAPSDLTSHVQECHIAVGHMLTGIIEQRLARMGRYHMTGFVPSDR